MDYLLGSENGGKPRGGPVGKARRIFEEVSKLPRHDQQALMRTIEAFLQRAS